LPFHTPSIFRWPEAAIGSSEGLGGGIAYAYDPQFCLDILDSFEERSTTWISFWDFVTCDAIKASILLAFDTWASNHPSIHFIDISEHCASEDLFESVDKEDCTSTNCVRCSKAEIMISTFTKDNEQDHSGARVVPVELSTRSALGTSGREEAGGSFRYVELQYANDICWYLDQTFCSTFFAAQLGGTDVQQLLLALFVVLELCACAIALAFLLHLALAFFRTLLDTWDTDGDGQIEVHEVLGAGRAGFAALCEWLCTGSLKRASAKLGGREINALDANLALLHTFSKLNVLASAFILTLIAFPPVFTTVIFNPCWLCEVRWRRSRARALHPSCLTPAGFVRSEPPAPLRPSSPRAV
jgi:hypothetical protein